MPIRTNFSHPTEFGSFEEKKRGKKPNQNKTGDCWKTSSRVSCQWNAFYYSGYPPKQNIKNWAWVSPLFSQAQATVELLGLHWIVTHSASVGRINTNTNWSNRRGYPFYLTFIFLNYTLKHLSLVQLSKSVVQCATYVFIHFYHLPCRTLSILTEMLGNNR